MAYSYLCALFSDTVLRTLPHVSSQIQRETCYMPTPNPTLNLPECWRMQNWYKNSFVDATVPFQLPYMQIWSVLSIRSYAGFEPELFLSKYVSVLRKLPNKPTVYENL